MSIHPRLEYESINYHSVSLAPSHPSRKPIPQLLFSTNKWGGTNRNAPDTIHYNLRGSQIRGVPMRELLARDIGTLCAMIASGTDQVFARCGYARVTLRVLWPGYPLDYQRTLDVMLPEGPMTRARLGQIVAQTFQRFIEGTQGLACSSPEWNVKNFKFDKLILLNVFHTITDSWQAEVEIEG